MSAIVEKLDSIFADRSTSVAKDLKLNLRRMMEDSSLSPEEAALTTIAVAKSLSFDEFVEAGKSTATTLGLSPEIVQEAEDNAAIMGMLNVYYRFRHFIEHNDPSAKDDYGPAKLRMTALANPAMGKEKFEMLAFAVSCINGCEMCVSSHEKALMALGVTRDKLHDLGRLAAVLKGLSVLK
ncbi:MAG: carboxymuconolactone decarboxylase family protein [Bdellovibrionota bacterium]